MLFKEETGLKLKDPKLKGKFILDEKAKVIDYKIIKI